MSGHLTGSGSQRQPQAALPAPRLVTSAQTPEHQLLLYAGSVTT